MRSVTQLKSLGDIRTTISTHARSTPRQGGSTYLQVYLLDMERQRLQTELLLLTRRQRRLDARLAEIREEMERLKQEAGSSSGLSPATPMVGKGSAENNPSGGQRWREMTVGY
jgi:chromosome segregation ATPase